MSATPIRTKRPRDTDAAADRRARRWLRKLLHSGQSVSGTTTVNSTQETTTGTRHGARRLETEGDNTSREKSYT
jgi:hypothetical protein